MRAPQPVAALFSGRVRQRLIALRRDLHRQPELSFQEERTAQRLYEELARLKPTQLDRVSGTGVVATIRGRGRSGPVVALRGDIDALPIQEETGLEFASEVPGVMHACGHDVHAAWIVGAAHLLTERLPAGDVRIVLQPGEEQGDGARAILKSGALDGVSAIFGGHVDRRFAVGEVVADTGPLAASADTFEIELIGKGAHGARPNEGADPIIGAAALVGALQTIVARRVHPGSPAVVTVGALHAGTAPNIIPERATLSGTLRATDGATRELLQRSVREIAKSTAAAHGLKARVSIEVGPPPIVNPPEPVAWARRAVAGLLGEKALVPLGFVNLGAEDFAYYLESVPGCFLRIGAREEGGQPIPAHSPRFYAAEESLFVGAAVLAETARIASGAIQG